MTLNQDNEGEMMTNYSERIDNIFQKLVSDITIAGYGKEDEPNDLIDKDDIQPFAGYLFHQNKAKQALTSLIKELVAEAKPEEYEDYYANDPIERGRKISYDEAVRELEQNLLKALEEV